jgi:hypothetical protein
MSLEAFRQSLSSTFDARRVSRRAAPHRGKVFEPDGHVDHAAVLVRGADGRLKTECVSSAAEVEALTQAIADEARR